ncbi:MAG: hypothetical protein WBW46_08380 [Candidatus Sulfotelmatobacter sp.]
MAAEMSAMIVTFAHLTSITSALPTDASALERSVSALESAVTTLENSSGWWDKSLPWFTGLVVLGLIADLVVVVWERVEEMTGWRRWVLVGIHFPDRPTRGRFILELLATTAIFLGVAGEFWAGVQIAYINGQLRSKNAELRSCSARLVALLAKETEDEHSARVKLEASVAWRHFSEQQKKDFSKKLGKYSGQRADIRYNDGDSEAAAFALSIADVLASAHWFVPSPQPLPTGVPPSLTTGVSIQGGVDVSTTKLLKPQRELLTRLLIDAGFDADASFTWKVAPDQEEGRIIAIAVKHRPEGPQGEYKLQAEQEAKTKNKAKSQP